MPWPLFVIGALIGAGAGYMATGDVKGALIGGTLGAVTGGMGGALMGPVAGATAGTAAATTGALAGTTAATTGATAAGLAAATPVYASGITASGLGAGGMGGGALTGTAMGTGAGLGYLAPISSSGGGYPAMNFAQRQAASAPYVTGGKQAAARTIDTSALGQSVQESLEEDREVSIDSRILPSFEFGGGGGGSIEDELALAAANMRKRSTRTPPGLRNIPPFRAARGGIMQVPSGSLTGGQLIGPGTGTSDSIRSSIFPDIASKLGASSSLPGKGHSVQRAALSDGEYVLTAKAVEGFGKKAGAPPGQEREYGSKLLDNVMNQMQRV